jgi:hypothetical protein
MLFKQYIHWLMDFVRITKETLLSCGMNLSRNVLQVFGRGDLQDIRVRRTSLGFI